MNVIEHWTDKKTGLLCLIIKHNTGHLCGYVGLLSKHPWFGKDYSDCVLAHARPRGKKEADSEYRFPKKYLETLSKRLVCKEGYCHHTPESLIDVHGGITFSDNFKEHGGPKIWWFGFDCAHAGDLVPDLLFAGERGVERDAAFVKNECEKMAVQLLEKA